ncbi:MAG TPA: putative zinc-binding metallopeptidase, partial [Chthoniobacterales bacterium]
LALQPRRAEDPLLPNSADIFRNKETTFDKMIAAWFPLTHVLNNLNRGLGLLDGYPFITSAPAIEKLRFIHETIQG